MKPIWIKEKCKQCGLCFPVCPDNSIPVGKDSKGLPVGMQLIGNCFEENKIIQTAYTFEQTKAYEAPELAKEDR